MLTSDLKETQISNSNLIKNFGVLESKLKSVVNDNNKYRAELSVRSKLTNENHVTDRLKVIEDRLLAIKPPIPSTTTDSPTSSLSAPPIVNIQQRPPAIHPHQAVSRKQLSDNSKQNNIRRNIRPLMSIKHFPMLTESEKEKATWRVFGHASNKLIVLGDSNLHAMLPIIKNRVRDIDARSVPGATFSRIHDAVVDLSPCDMLVLQGGTNDALQRDHPTDAIPDLKRLIKAAKLKARKVIIIPPPPTCSLMRTMENIMLYEANHMQVDFIVVSHLFPSSGPRLFRDDLHCTKRGAGIYGLALLDYLKTWTNVVKNTSELSCIACHHSGHHVTSCTLYNAHKQSSRLVTPPPQHPQALPKQNYYRASVPTYNRFQVLTTLV